MTKKKINKIKMTDPHKESRAKKEETGKDNEKIYYLWVTVITPDICQILQENPNGKLKMVLFRMKK